ncbi:MAG: hypothetical protein M3N97_08785 [Pseudomonadota bacterium]|nr:hypothetical protein [Pseudomonadota bacterium]
MPTPIYLLSLAGRRLICRTLLPCALGFLPSALALAAGEAPGTAAGGRPVQAVPAEPGLWQKHEYSFTYQGFTTTYSCDGLADKLRVLLIASGARPDAKAWPGACAAGWGQPDKLAQAKLTFYTLAPAGRDVPAEAAPGTTAPGVWIPVVTTVHKPRELDPGDCELVEQFRSSLLPMFTTRNIDDHTTCIPHQESGSNIDLKFESFGAAPPSGRTQRTGSSS